MCYPRRPTIKFTASVRVAPVDAHIAPSRKFNFLLTLSGATVLVTSVAILWLRYIHGSPTTDLNVYRQGALAFLGGDDAYLTRYGNPPRYAFTYPPIAFLAFAPLGFLSLSLARVTVWTISAGLLVLAVHILSSTAVGGRLESSAKRWLLTLTLSAMAFWLEPVRHTLFLGQINLILFAVIVYDTLAANTRIPRGILVGLTTAVKLTPGIFIIYFWLTGRRRAATNALIAAASTTALASTFAPTHSWNYWTQLVFDVRRVGRTTYVANQSLRGLIGRAYHSMTPPPHVVLPAAMAVTCIGLYLAARLHKCGETVLGIGVAGVTGLLVSPISWNHHWIWVLPVIVRLVTWAIERRSAALWLITATWSAVYIIGPMWQVEHDTNDLRYSPNGALDVVRANAYVLAGCAMLVSIPAALLIANVRRSTQASKANQQLRT